MDQVLDLVGEGLEILTDLFRFHLVATADFLQNEFQIGPLDDVIAVDALITRIPLPSGSTRRCRR